MTVKKKKKKSKRASLAGVIFETASTVGELSMDGLG